MQKSNCIFGGVCSCLFLHRFGSLTNRTHFSSIILSYCILYLFFPTRMNLFIYCVCLFVCILVVFCCCCFLDSGLLQMPDTIPYHTTVACLSGRLLHLLTF